MNAAEYAVYLGWLILAIFISKYHCLQSGLRIQYFTKMDVGIGNLSSHMSTVATVQDGVTSSAKCATACAETDWCSGYLVCKNNRPSSLCVLLQVNTDTNGQMTQNNSDYASCFLYMPSNFQLMNKSNLSTTTSSTTTATSPATVTTTTKETPSTTTETSSTKWTTTTTSPSTPTPTTTTSTLSTTRLPSTTISSATVSTTSPTKMPYDPPSFCKDAKLKPSKSNDCEYGLKPGCKTYYKDCQESYDMHKYTDVAIYRIKPDGYPTPFKVKCSGGRRSRLSGFHPRVTHIQRNSFLCCPFTSFNQSWAAYREGFGDLDNFSCSYWLGNEKLAAMTAQRPYNLIIHVSKRVRRRKKEAFYTNFSVANESSNFKMQYNSFENTKSSFWSSSKLDDGFTAVNARSQNLNGAQFYTYDHDNVGKCAATLGSGWWFDTDCARVNLNTDHDPQWYIRGTLETFEHADMYLQ